MIDRMMRAMGSRPAGDVVAPFDSKAIKLRVLADTNRPCLYDLPGPCRHVNCLEAHFKTLAAPQASTPQDASIPANVLAAIEAMDEVRAVGKPFVPHSAYDTIRDYVMRPTCMPGLVFDEINCRFQEPTVPSANSELAHWVGRAKLAEGRLATMDGRCYPPHDSAECSKCHPTTNAQKPIGTLYHSAVGTHQSVQQPVPEGVEGDDGAWPNEVPVECPKCDTPTDPDYGNNGDCKTPQLSAAQGNYLDMLHREIAKADDEYAGWSVAMMDVAEAAHIAASAQQTVVDERSTFKPSREVQDNE